MKKILIIIPFLFILTGCTVNYNLEINGDSVIETITGTVAKEESQMNENATDIPLIYDLINNQQTAIFNDENELYVKNINDIGNNLEYMYSYVYNNNYAKSKVVNTCFEKREIYENNEIYHVHLSGEFYCLYTDSITINVISNNRVVSTNAKKVNNNVYTWVIDKANKTDIQIDISKTEPFEKTKKSSNTFRIVSFIILIVLCGTVLFLYKFKNSDI